MKGLRHAQLSAQNSLKHILTCTSFCYNITQPHICIMFSLSEGKKVGGKERKRTCWIYSITKLSSAFTIFCFLSFSFSLILVLASCSLLIFYVLMYIHPIPPFLHSSPFLHFYSVLGIHVNMLMASTIGRTMKVLLGSVLPAGVVVDVQDQHKVYPLGQKFSMLLQESGYMHIQASKPDTIGMNKCCYCYILLLLTFALFIVFNVKKIHLLLPLLFLLLLLLLLPLLLLQYYYYYYYFAIIVLFPCLSFSPSPPPPPTTTTTFFLYCTM